MEKSKKIEIQKIKTEKSKKKESGKFIMPDYDENFTSRLTKIGLYED